MCRVRTRLKREASSQHLTRKTSHMLNIPHNFFNGFELISKMTRATSQSAEIGKIPCLMIGFAGNKLALFTSRFPYFLVDPGDNTGKYGRVGRSGCVACQHCPDHQTLRPQAGAGEDDFIHLLSGPDGVACERQEEDSTG